MKYTLTCEAAWWKTVFFHQGCPYMPLSLNETNETYHFSLHGCFTGAGRKKSDLVTRGAILGWLINRFGWQISASCLEAPLFMNIAGIGRLTM